MEWQQAIERYALLKPKDRIIVGVSGGPDSMALVHLLQQSAQQYGCFLAVVHVNHLLRGEQAKREADFVADWCHKQGLPCLVEERDVQALAKAEGLSIEAAGHQARFQVFQEAAIRFDANKLALGHHQDDRAETVLLHLIQGTGIDGLAALAPAEGWIIRPLIEATKEELLAYCKEEGLPYFWDASNDELWYLRNRIRHQLLPLLKAEYNPQMSKALVRLAVTAQEDSRYLEEQTRKAWEGCARVESAAVYLDLSQWRNLPLAIGRRVLRRCYGVLEKSGQGLSYQQTEALVALAKSEFGQKALDLPGRIRAVKSYDQLRMTREESKMAPAFELCWPIMEPLCLPDGSLLTAEWSEKPLSYSRDYKQVLLDGERLPQVLTVRTRRPGDQFKPLGMQGKKKVKKYFIDKKIPQSARDSWPLVFNGEELIWLPGLALAEGCQATEKTQKYCRLTYILADEAGILPKTHETN